MASVGFLNGLLLSQHLVGAVLLARLAFLEHHFKGNEEEQYAARDAEGVERDAQRAKQPGASEGEEEKDQACD